MRRQVSLLMFLTAAVLFLAACAGESGRIDDGHRAARRCCTDRGGRLDQSVHR